MATREEIYTAIRNADKAGDTESVRKLGAYLQTMQEPAAPAGGATESFPQQLGRAVLNAGAGAIRGAGSIGATILTPYDMLAGNTKSVGNPERRQAMDEALKGLGAETDSVAYGAGKLGAEIAGTAGVGGAVANTLARVPGVSAAVPNLLEAIRTAGMSAGASQNAIQSAFMRAAGGAATGAASAGMVNPEDAATGAAIGGVAPGVLQAAGAAGRAVGKVVRGPKVPADTRAAVQAARQSGYVIPPTQAKPTLANRVMEGVAGKITTAQNASAKNQGVTARLAAEALGLPAETKLTPDVLTNVRNAAGQAYDAVASSGVIRPGEAYNEALDRIALPHVQASVGFPAAKVSPVVDMVNSLRSEAFDASSAVAKIKELRSAADDAYRAGNTDVGRASKAAAKALEDAIEAHLQQIGNADALTAFREARQLIAKTYSVQKAMNPTTGAIDARKLGAQLKAGKPLSGGLKEAADFANRFPKAAQPVENMGSLPQTSPLDWAMGGGLAMGTGNPLMLASMLTRPTARAAVLSPMVQNRLATPQGNPLTALTDPRVRQFLLRASPVGLAGDQ